MVQDEGQTAKESGKEPALSELTLDNPWRRACDRKRFADSHQGQRLLRSVFGLALVDAGGLPATHGIYHVAANASIC